VREKVIRMLDYARTLARGNMELQNCPHAGNYAGEDQRCRECDYGFECDWLLAHDLDVVLQTKTLDELAEALNFALSYVDAQVTRWGGHPRRRCRCEACRWLRDATAVQRQLIRSAPPDAGEVRR